MPTLSHLISCTPNKSNLYLANSLAAIVICEPDLYRLLTFHVPNLMSLFHCFRSYQRISPGPRHVFMFRNYKSLYGELLAPRPIPKKENDPLSAVRDCLYHIFAAILHIGGRSSIRNLKKSHAVVTGTHLSRLAHMYCVHSYITLGKRKKRLCLDYTITTSVT